VPTGHAATTPRGVGAGLALGSDTSVKLTADWRGDFDRTARSTNRYAVGVEALLGGTAPLRAAWQRDETHHTSWWSAGIGLVTQGGVSLDLGYRQSIASPDARTIVVSLVVYNLDMAAP